MHIEFAFGFEKIGQRMRDAWEKCKSQYGGSDVAYGHVQRQLDGYPSKATFYNLIAERAAGPVPWPKVEPALKALEVPYHAFHLVQIDDEWVIRSGESIHAWNTDDFCDHLEQLLERLDDIKQDGDDHSTVCLALWLLGDRIHSLLDKRPDELREHLNDYYAWIGRPRHD